MSYSSRLTSAAVCFEDQSQFFFGFWSVRSSDFVMLQTSKYKSAIPTPPTGSVWSFQGVQTLIGLAIAIPLEYFHAEAFLQKILNFSSENGNGLALAVAALVTQLVMLPGMNGLIRAREEQKVGQPIHHPAPGELASEDDRTSAEALQSSSILKEMIDTSVSWGIRCFFKFYFIGLNIHTKAWRSPKNPEGDKWGLQP